MQPPRDEGACGPPRPDGDIARFFELSLDLFCIAGFDGRFLRVNSSFSRLLGYSDHELLTRPYLDFVHPDDRAATVNEVARLPEGLETVQFRNRYRDIGGNYRWFEWMARPVPEEGLIYAVARDVTDRLQMERQLLVQEQQMKLARTVQQKLYPSSPPRIEGFDVAGIARPVLELCGDYYDYVAGLNGRTYVVVGDVSGHGLGPALQMVELRALLRTLLRRSDDLAAILTEVNQLLCQDLPESMFISLYIAELDPAGRRIRSMGAGHCAWFVAGDGRIRRLRSTGTVLGVVPTAEFAEDAPISVVAGDVLLLSTDGMLEAMSPDEELFGKERLTASIAQNRHKPAPAILDALFDDVERFVRSRPVKDDITAVVIKAI